LKAARDKGRYYSQVDAYLSEKVRREAAMVKDDFIPKNDALPDFGSNQGGFHPKSGSQPLSRFDPHNSDALMAECGAINPQSGSIDLDGKRDSDPLFPAFG
jgi:hypothetical protein